MQSIRKTSAGVMKSPSLGSNGGAGGPRVLQGVASYTLQKDDQSPKRQKRSQQSDETPKKKSRNGVQDAIDHLQTLSSLETPLLQGEEQTTKAKSGKKLKDDGDSDSNISDSSTDNDDDDEKKKEKKSRKPRKKKGFLFNENLFEETKIPFPILQHSDGHDPILDSPILTLWSPKDLDVVWLLEFLFHLEMYYQRLMECKEFDERVKFYKEIALDPVLNGNQELLMAFATMSLDSFRVASSVIQHLCARIDSTKFNNLGEVIEKGIFVFYSYVYYYWAGYNEMLIIKHVAKHMPPRVEVVLFDEAFERAREEFRESAKDRYVSIDAGAPAIVVDYSTRNELAEKTSSVFKGNVKPSQSAPRFNPSAICRNVRFSSNASNQPPPPSSSSPSALVKPVVKKIMAMKYLSSELQEQLFPTKPLPPTDPGEVYKQLFINKHKDRVPVPQFIIKVPWTEVLKIVGKRQSYYMEDGFAFLDYTQIADWMRDKWHVSVSKTVQWDKDNIAWPWLDNENEKYKDLMPMNIDQSYVEFIRFLGEFQERQFVGPLRQKMRSGMFTSLIPKDALDSYGNPEDVIPFIYTPVFEHGKALEQRMRVKAAIDRLSSAGARAAGELPKEEEIFYQPLLANITGDFYKDYGLIMPPCIRSMYDTHVQNGTHFKNEERLKFFWWAFKASVPLDTVMDMWNTMVDNDSQLPAREKKSVKREGEGLYLKQQRSREAGNERHYFGCAKMKSHCPFVGGRSSCSSNDVGDIEDLATRKIKCGNSMWDNRIPVASPKIGFETRWPGRYLVGWSPMTATAILTEYYMNKI